MNARVTANADCYTDWCQTGIGAVLTQEHEGVERVVAYGSRMLRGPELHLAATIGECVAVVYFIKHFRTYLHERKFTVICLSL